MSHSSVKKSITAFLSLILLFATLVSNANEIKPSPLKNSRNKVYVTHFEHVMGTSFEMKTKASSSKRAQLAEKIALSEINRLSKILSAYDQTSEFSSWFKTQNIAVKVSPELLEVLSLFDNWKATTNGALNPAFETINQVWKTAAINQVLPSNELLQSAVNNAKQQHWSINIENGTVTHLTAAPLILNTFVKSYIINRATQKVISAAGVDGVVMNIGGDIMVAGDENETIEIVNPLADAINDPALAEVKLQHQFIATSGNYRRGSLINGKWYSHIIDPRTGFPVENVISATVVANNATDAGALATAFNVLSIQESIVLAKQFPDVAYLIITQNGERIQNEKWETIEMEKKQTISTSNEVKNDQWDPAYEMVVNLELAQFQGQYRRPFVAIWVENKDKAPIRTLTVWYNKPRWLHELRAWYTANHAKYNVESGTMASIASATRMAGKYAIKWDGKDDNGEYIKTGNYTIYIEVAREHGTYQLITQEIKINNKANQIELPANTEVAAASLEVKKKGNE